MEKITQICAVFMVVISLCFACYMEGYRCGQIDFLKGNIKYQSITNQVVTIEVIK